MDSFEIQQEIKKLDNRETEIKTELEEIETKRKILLELDGVLNTIWAYQIEFHDLEESHRIEVIETYKTKAKKLNARLKAIDLKKKLNDKI